MVCLAGKILLSISNPILRFIILRSNSVWRLSQNWASIPKYRSSLNAVSAVMALFPFTISLILLGGTERSLESWFMLIPKGSKKSSRRISPGFIGSRLSFLVIIAPCNMSSGVCTWFITNESTARPFGSAEWTGRRDGILPTFRVARSSPHHRVISANTPQPRYSRV